MRIAQISTGRQGRLDRGDQVAAVCFRLNGGEAEFLLVRTGNGRWTFPKGRPEIGLTRAQSAAMEAFEEAGVHGRIEEVPFARYSYRKRRARHVGSREELVIDAHLCEVSCAGRPQESRRNPKWFSAEKAKGKLQDGRDEHEGAELTRVIDLAVTRLRPIRTARRLAADHLQKVKFDAFEVAGTPPSMQHSAMRRYIRRESKNPPEDWIESRSGVQRLLTGKVLPLTARKA